MLHIPLKPHLILQLLHHIKNDGASFIMHKSGKQPVFKIGQVQGGKFFTAFKTVFVNTAFVITEKGTGHSVHDHRDVGFVRDNEAQSAMIKLDENEVIDLIVPSILHRGIVKSTSVLYDAEDFFAFACQHTTLATRRPEHAVLIRTTRENADYLPGVELPGPMT